MAAVTAFVTTIGATTFEQCVAQLRLQTVKVKVVVLSDVKPFYRALQKMVDRCATQFYLQVDEDMLLHADAAERMLAMVDGQSADVASASAPLYDRELETPIFGLKIWRHAAVKTVPFRPHVTHDRFQRDQLVAAGYRFIKAPRDLEHCVGDHGTCYTPEQRFARWRRLWQKVRNGGGQQTFVRTHLPVLAERYRATGSRSDLYALAGALFGAVGDRWPASFDPYDARHVDEDLRRLVELFPTVDAGEPGR